MDLFFKNKKEILKDMQDNKEIIEYIEKKLKEIRHGQIVLTLYNNNITKIETNEKISFSEKNK